MVHLTAFDVIDDAALQALELSLNHHAADMNAPLYQETPLSVLAHNDAGSLIGGLNGKTVWNWLYIDILWVDAAYRGRGIARNLVAAAEVKALARGCHSSYLWTESFQGPDFYPKLGYQQFVVNEDFPLGHQRIGFMKRIAA